MLDEGGRLQELRDPALGFSARRSVGWSSPNLLCIRQHLVVRAPRLGTDVTGPYWVFAIVRVRRGAVSYLQDPGHVRAPARSFALFLPPWSVVQARLAWCRLSTEAYASADPAPEGSPLQAVAWPWPRQRILASVDDVRNALIDARHPVSVHRAPSPPPSVERTKRLMDATYRTADRLADLAARSRVTPAAMSRSFKRAYGMPPVEYRHRLRVMDAVYRLASGGEIVRVLGEVGFKDVSRSYHHFRSLLCASPGQYTLRRSRNAKT